MTRDRSFKHGFTLTEVLVASTLLSIIMTAVYSLFFSAISTWRSAEGEAGYHRTARSLMTLIARDYANLHPGGSHLFEGTADEVSFVIVAPPLDVEHGEGSRLMRVRYRFDREAGVVTREEAVVDGALPPAASPADRGRGRRLETRQESTFDLGSGVREFRLTYLWTQRPDSAYWRQRPIPVAPVSLPRHQAGWGLPQALEIDFSLADDDTADLPMKFSACLTTRALNRQRDAWELARMREAAP